MDKSRRTIHFLLIAALMLLPLSSNPASANAPRADLTETIIYYVKPGASGDCLSWDTACDLQPALTHFTAPDQIWVAMGRYIPTTTGDREATFLLKPGVTILGGFPADGGGLGDRDWLVHTTILSGDLNGDDQGSTGYDENSYHVVTINDVDATPILDGFIISGGNANGTWPHNSGGGIYNLNGDPYLSNLIICDNFASGNGAGMTNLGGNPHITYVTFSGNIAILDGGGMINGSSNLSLNNVAFIGNWAANFGGGIATGGNLTLTDVIFSGNAANWLGGGIYRGGGNLTVVNGLFYSNGTVEPEGQGGAIYSSSGNHILTNVTLSNNHASAGGGIMSVDSEFTLTNVTFTDNEAFSEGIGGGGMYNYASNPVLKNCILWGNTPDQISGEDAIVTFSVIQGGYAGEGNIDLDPLLLPLANNGGFSQTHALGDESPAIDAANPALCPIFDQRGFLRPIDGNLDGIASCDMGAYEFGSSLEGFPLSVNIAGQGSVTKDPDQSEYFYGEQVLLTASADPGWFFSGWSGDVAGNLNPLIFTVIGETNIDAVFSIAFYNYLPAILK